jgi:hypothetical protein
MSPPAADRPDALSAPAARALDALVQAGADLLQKEPWRAGRIIRGGEGLTLTALRAEVARRRALPPADFNRALALAQLVCAIGRPDFSAAWEGRGQAAATPGANRSRS